MPGNRFNPTLDILEGDQTGVRPNQVVSASEVPEADRPKLSVCAMGEVAEAEELTWMRVFVFQQTGTEVAAAFGIGGQHLGGHHPVESENLPFTHEKGWMVQTQLEHGADQFSEGPAMAVAVARVIRTKPDGTKEDDVDVWTQPVMIGEHEHPHD
jgi:hypothetical protein